MNWKGVFALKICLLFAGSAGACDDDDADGLDVGLVLSGGGALATTHIGALTVIQELGVPIHCVVGTSMGSVVGALFAAGFDAEQLQQVFRDARWPDAFNGRVARRYEPYLRKEEDDQYLSGYLAGIDRNGLKLPGGLRSMSGLQRLFRGLLRNQPVPADFDKLSRPYRAVATDLSTGKPVGLANGDLVEAMLASMAVPGVFAPRTIDGRVLVDGGLAAQLPVDVAQALGADLIIALDTTVEPPIAEADWSVAQVSQQLIRLKVWDNWLRQRARLSKDDVLIQPDLAELSTSSFQKADQGFASGIAAARAAAAELVRIRDLAAPPLPPGEPRTRETTGRISETIIVENDSSMADRLIQKRFGFRPSDIEKPRRLESKLRDLAAFGPFGEVDLRLSDSGAPLLRVKPLPLGRNLLSGGFRAANNFRGDSRYALLGRLSRRPLRSNGGELRISAEVGTDLGLSGELYVPFGSESRFFSNTSLSYRADQLLLDVGDVRIGEFWQQRGDARLRFGRELGDWGILAIDGLVSAIKTETLVSLIPLGGETDRFGGGGVLFGVDTLDRANWPTAGLQLRARGSKLKELGRGGGSSENHRLQVLKPYSFGPVDLHLRLDAQTTENSEGNPINIQRLGGFRRLTAVAENSVLNDRYVLGSVEVFRRLSPADTVFSIPLFLGALFEYADVRLELIDPAFEERFKSAAGYLGIDTAFGPLFIGAGFDGDGDYSLFLNFGKTF